MRNRNGFTLVELMVVVIIIGLLAMLAIPRFLGTVNKSKVAEFKPVLKQIISLQMLFREEHKGFSSDATGYAIGFSHPENVEGTNSPNNRKGASRFEYQIQDASLGGVLGVARPVNDNVIKDAYGKPLLSTKDFGCADTANIYTASSAAFVSVSNLSINPNCKYK